VATAATLVYHAISLWVPAVWGTIACIVLQKTKGSRSSCATRPRNCGQVPAELSTEWPIPLVR